MRIQSILALVSVAVMLAACGEQNAENARRGGVAGGGGITKADVGTLAGAGLGAWAGSNVGSGAGRTAAIAVGALAGAGIGRELGASLDRADMAYFNRAQQQALETSQPGQTLPWSNQQSGNSGTFTPSNYYQTAEGTYCREFQQTITVGGKTEKAFGRACRQPDGSWQIVQ
ncbi:MAG: RT0821/Lpp0805 family surface protein [Alphaproteobacteria bacterium]